MHRMMSAPPKEIGRRRRRRNAPPEARMARIWRAVKTTARRAWNMLRKGR